MSNIELFLDTAMCLLWIATYTLVLIGTIKYKYPLISPITQAIIAPLEFSVFILCVITSATFNYAVVAYMYWSIIEVAIFVAIMKTGSIKKKLLYYYIVLSMVVFATMIILVVCKRQVLFYNYLNTFTGMLFWFGFIFKKDYPMKPFALFIFIIKFIADIFAAIVYCDDGVWITDMLCILLPILDFLFIVVYFIRRREKKEARHAL